jgi:multidrug efflux pump
MKIADLSIRRPVLVIVLNIILLLFGFLGYRELGVREYPAIDPPVITIRTNYTGANAEIIESQITEPLEKVINGIAGIRTISSASNQGNSSITVEFELGIDLEDAANDVRDKVSQATRNLPLDIDGPPVVSKADANADAIVSMTVQSNTRSQLEVCDYAMNVLLERLQTIPGVSNVQVWGEKKYAMRIWFLPDQMAARNLTVRDVQTALDKENVELPAGKLVGGATEFTIQTKGRLETEAAFRNMVVSTIDGNIVRLGDIARVELGPEREETMLKESGVPMVALALVPQPGANYLDISKEFYKRFEQLKAEVPEDVYLNIALDNTLFIKRSIDEVGVTILIAFGLVILIIFLFFRDIRMAIRPLLDIPISLIATFFVMYLLGFTINVLTLLGIVLATGLVVDDGIVVTENIYKKLEKGFKPMQAAREGTNEIFFAVIVTSVTLAVVFLPLLFISGFVGKLFTEFGVVIAVAVLISSFVALTITPVLNVVFARSSGKKTKFYIKTEPFFLGLEQFYARTLSVFMQNKRFAWFLLLLCGGAIYYFMGVLKSELSPLEDRDQFRFALSMPEGTSFEAMDEYVMQIVGLVEDQIPEKEIVLSVTAPGFIGSGAPNTGFIRVRLSDASTRTRSQQEIVDQVSPLLSNFPEGRVFPIQEQSIASQRRGGLPVQMVLQNSDFEKIRTALPLFLDKIAQSPVFMGFDTDLKFNKPELEVVIDRDKAAELGISVLDVAQTLQMAFSGRRFSYFTMKGKQYQVIAQMDYDNRNKVEDMGRLFVKNAKGEPIRLDNLIRIEERSNPPQLFHYNRYKSVTVSAGLSPGFTIGDGNKEMEALAKQVLDPTFSTEFTGQSRDFAESAGNTSFAFFFALILVYLILAAQFESFASPFIIMLTVPLAIAGALLTLWLFDQTLNIFSQIGIIMLLGLVTKNGILIVEFANQLLEKGYSVSAAAKEAAVLRLRPILMTTLATILGALPIALALGAGAESRKPLGMVVVGGLLFSLILTLYVIPALYPFFIRKSRNKENELF